MMPSGGAFGGGPPPVRRNMFNVVLIVDLAMPVAWSTIDALERYVEAGVPLRIAHVLMESSREDGPNADTARVSEDARALAAMLGLDPDHGGDDRAARADPTSPRRYARRAGRGDASPAPIRGEGGARVRSRARGRSANHSARVPVFPSDPRGTNVGCGERRVRVGVPERI